jgi:hypothetical protein
MRINMAAMRLNCSASRAEEPPEQHKPQRRETPRMDPRTTLEGTTVQAIATTYFNSLNTTNKKMHLVESKQAGREEIEADIKAWMAGFYSCATLLNVTPTNLPPLESVTGLIVKQFPEKANLAA